MSKKRNAPPGCYWRNGVLWGRTKIKGQEYRWSLHTDDQKVARERRKAGQRQTRRSRAPRGRKVHLGEVVADWSPWIEKQVGAQTAQRYATSLKVLTPLLDGKFFDQIDGKFVARSFGYDTLSMT